MSKSDVSEYINELLSKQKFRLIIDFATQKLNENKTDHWLLGVKASAHYELRDYEKSKEVLSEALNLKEDCPLLWWHLAGVLEALGDIDDAITVWNQIISFDNSDISFLDDPCWESPEFKRGLIADSSFRVGKAYLNMGNQNEALRYIKQFLDWKILADEEELESIYSVKEGLRLYNKLEV